MIASLFIVLSFVSVRAEEVPKCTFESVSNKCRLLKEQMNTQQIWLPDGTTFRNPEFDNSFWSWVYKAHHIPSSITPARQTRVNELVDMARQSILQRILKRRTPDQLTPGEKSQYDRVSTISFDVTRSMNNDSFKCAGTGRNAFYSTGKHEITLCRTTMMMPDASLLFVIAHEMGHSIDPCQMSLGLYSTNETPPPEPFFAEGGSTQVGLKAIFSQQPPDFDSLVAEGRATQVAPGISMEEYPERGPMGCFIDQGLGVRISPDRIPFLSRALMVRAQAQKKPWEELTMTQAGVEAGMRRAPMCWQTQRVGNPINETMSDMWGARALADYWKANPPQTELDKFAGFATFLEDVCGPGASAPHPEAGVFDMEDGLHANGRDRFDRIILANPGVQRALGCQPANPVCDHDPAAQFSQPVGATSEAQTAN